MSVGEVANAIDATPLDVSGYGRRRLRQLMRRTLAATMPGTRFLVSGPRSSGRACLTFDDGPDPLTTPRILDTLGEQGVRATFFVLGRQVADNPELLARIVSEGHLVGHHSWSHGEPSQTTCRELLNEVDQTQSLFRSLGVTPSRWFRPPKGRLTATKLLGLWCKAQIVVLWNHDVRDYQAEQASVLRDRFVQRPVCAGDIVLLHDNQQCTAGFLPELIAQTRQRGVELDTPLAWLPHNRRSNLVPTLATVERG